jgi:hypothetical protein
VKRVSVPGRKEKTVAPGVGKLPFLGVRRRPMPQFSDGEAFLRLGIPDGLMTDGSEPEKVAPVLTDSEMASDKRPAKKER